MHQIIAFLLLNANVFYAHDLQLNLEVGQTYSQNFQSAVTIKQTIMGMEQEIKSDIYYQLDFEVTSATGSSYEMTVQYRSMKMKLVTAMGEVEMSSDNVTDPSDPNQSLMSHLVNKPFYVNMSNNGSIGEVSGLEAVIESVFGNYPDASEEQKALLRAQLEQGYGEDAFRGNMELITAVLPQGTVDIGEQWTRSVDVQTTMPVTTQSTFTLKEVNATHVLIDGTGTMKTTDQVSDINGMPAKYITSGETSSQIKLDPDTNWIASAEITQVTEGEVEILPSENLPDGLKFPMVMEIQTTISN